VEKYDICDVVGEAGMSVELVVVARVGLFPSAERSAHFFGCYTHFCYVHTFTPASAPSTLTPASLQPSRALNTGLSGLLSSIVLTGYTNGTIAAVWWVGDESPLNTYLTDRVQSLGPSDYMNVETT